MWLTLSLAVAGAALYFAPGLPDVRQLQDFELQAPLRIFTHDGKLIGEFGEERRIAVDYDEIPEPLIQALLAAEDASFFEHPGVDPSGLAHAALELDRGDIVGKTGTTNDQRDAWFAGYNADLAVSVWIDFMGQEALNGRPEATLERPTSVVSARIDPESGRRLRNGQPGGISELFHADHLPEFEPYNVGRDLEQHSGAQGSGSFESIF